MTSIRHEAIGWSRTILSRRLARRLDCSCRPDTMTPYVFFCSIQSGHRFVGSRLKAALRWTTNWLAACQSGEFSTLSVVSAIQVVEVVQ